MLGGIRQHQDERTGARRTSCDLIGKVVQQAWEAVWSTQGEQTGARSEIVRPKYTLAFGIKSFVCKGTACRTLAGERKREDPSDGNGSRIGKGAKGSGRTVAGNSFSAVVLSVVGNKSTVFNLVAHGLSLTPYIKVESTTSADPIMNCVVSSES
jgi:hypothetical protein